MSQIRPAKWYFGAVPAGPGAAVFHTLPDAYERICSVSEPALGGCRFLAVGLEPRVDQRDDPIDHRMAEPLLPGDQLHQLVGAFDVGRAVLQSPRGRGRARETLCCRSVFFERHQIVRRGAELDAEVEHEIVDRARL